MIDIALPPNTLAGRGIGDNKPPLSELLAEELATDKARAEELLTAAREARIESAADAGKVADLLVLLHEHERAVDRARDDRKRPHLTDCRVIDAAFGAIIAPLARARTGPGSLSEMLTEWRSEHGETPLATSIAAVGSRREIKFCIEDIPATLGWLIQHRGGEITQAARTIIGTHLRSLGVDAASDADIPGVSVTIQTRTQVR